MVSIGVARILVPIFRYSCVGRGLSSHRFITSASAAEMSTSLAFEIRAHIESFPLREEATWTSGSSRQHHEGLTVPVMRTYVKKFRNCGLSYNQWESTLNELYGIHTKNVEEIFIAGFLLCQYPKHRKQLPMALLVNWIGNLQGWAEIDVTCQSTFSAKELVQRWDTDFYVLLANDLLKSSKLSHQRASLVLLLRSLRESPDERFLQVALQNVHSLKEIDHKLITKAISWILRTALKHHRDRVHLYVEENAASLPSVAVREFRKKYETGTK